MDYWLYGEKRRTGPQILDGHPNDRLSAYLTILLGNPATSAFAAAAGHYYCGYVAHVSASLAVPLHGLDGGEHPAERYLITIFKKSGTSSQCCNAALVLVKKLAKL
jgi:hypothetical protein